MKITVKTVDSESAEFEVSSEVGTREHKMAAEKKGAVLAIFLSFPPPTDDCSSTEVRNIQENGTQIVALCARVL